MMLRRFALGLLLAVAGATIAAHQTAPTRIVLIAGRPSHGPGMHEHRAGSMLLQKALSGRQDVTVEVFTDGWPTKMVGEKRVDDHAALDGAAAIFIYADGGSRHPALQGDRVKVHRRPCGEGRRPGIRTLRRRSPRRRARRHDASVARRVSTRPTTP